MIEFWACVGLACMDKSFLNALKDLANIKNVAREYGFRLSYFELCELKRLLAHPGIVANMEAIYGMGCPKPMHCFACVKHMASPGYRERYEAIHELLINYMEEMPDPPDTAESQ